MDAAPASSRTVSWDSLTVGLILMVPSIQAAEALTEETRQRPGFFIVHSKPSLGRLRVIPDTSPVPDAPRPAPRSVPDENEPNGRACPG